MSDNGGEPTPAFSFGEMALQDEPGRALPANNLGRVFGDDLSQGSGDGRLRGILEQDAGAAPVLHDAVARLRTALLNEENAPEILEYQTEIVEKAQNLVAEQTDRVDEAEDEEASLETHLQRMEIDRINYMLRCYFRCRIKKIERCVYHIFKGKEAGEAVFDRLSEAEQTFAIGYSDVVEAHFESAFFSMLPSRLRVIDKDGNADIASGPNLDTFVFCEVVNSVGPYALSDDPNDEPFDLTKDDVVCARYGGIRKLVEDGDINLI